MKKILCAWIVGVVLSQAVFAGESDLGLDRKKAITDLFLLSKYISGATLTDYFDEQKDTELCLHFGLMYPRVNSLNDAVSDFGNTYEQLPENISKAVVEIYVNAYAMMQFCHDGARYEYRTIAHRGFSATYAKSRKEARDLYMKIAEINKGLIENLRSLK